MKFEITRKRLQEVKGRVLNDYILDKNKNVRKFDSFIIISDPQEIEFEIYEPFFEYDFTDGRLFVRDDVFNSFIDMFASNEKQAIEDISDWFSKKFDVEVKFVE
jgi:hypothetical protein